ncbi:GNAT family N-acetyltransferase [Streptococcus salivarius]|uniref:GNAT family N-acetyltransferase n=1 Tax=Streptococcus salivarius TaxID=1304 RepID=UPI0002250E6C|nr:GNAT family N-acetyltransferase [Streptococcus salivarius]EGX29582.1 acetyltransferase [Streptococcus salivarius M18]MBZ5847390.1 GNAT family N-acetyltransferase [Streptococcus salivarius]MTQ30586.1 GNAT family N-acetyltransferase [Streptococcus salivarius]MTQ38188.1 GNAT family N-acetyltransferase [Streptococcus salivarius]MTQ44756.1 GNAT family N-acetyltransferase [Streptococcus salivarius]
MILRRPSQTDKEAILEMMAEFEREQSAHDGGFWNPDNFVYEEWLEENLQAETGLNIPENWVPAIQLVSFDEAGHALGFLNLRLRLNDYLLEKGGHIGYSIRPSERGKGYAKESLRQGLQVAKDKNIHRALVTCSIKNSASRAVILANGGQLEDIRHETERYWIDLE